MLVRKFDLSAFEPMGECRYRGIYPWEGVAAPPFASGWTHLKPGERTKKHQHHEFETYFVAYGHGEMRVNEERLPVGPGDVLFMPPFNDHVLTYIFTPKIFLRSRSFGSTCTVKSRGSF